MRENDMQGVIRRVKLAFKDPAYMRRLQTTDKNWVDENVEAVSKVLISFLEEI